MKIFYWRECNCLINDTVWQAPEIVIYNFVLPLLSLISLFATPWAAAHQVPLSFTISRSLLKLMSIELMMPSNNLILCHPFFPCLQSFSTSGVVVLEWTRTWWSRVNDEKMKEGKRLIFPGLHSRPSRSRESARNRKRERERERERWGIRIWWNKGALLNSVRVYIPVASLDKDQETRLYKFTKEARSNRGHKAKRQSISKEGCK